MTTTIALRDVIRSQPATTDPHGMLFEYEGRILRAFRGREVAVIRRLLNADWLPDLIAAGFIPFREADLMVEGFDLVVEADRVPVVTYPPEWPTVMLAEAGKTIARVGGVLARHGLGLKDAHPWNVLFDGTSPLFVDLGSVVPSAAVTREWTMEFRRYVILPLALRKIRLFGIADAVQGSQRSGWIRQLDRPGLRLFPARYAALARRVGNPTAFFRRLTAYVDALSSHGAPTKWTNYYGPSEPRVGDLDRYDAKQRSVDLLLDELPAGSVLDVGSNAGWYAWLAASKGHTVTAIDTDDPSLSRLYLNARAAGVPILPTRMDWMWPTGSSGFGLEYRAAPVRLRSDTVVALAVLHHLAGFQGVRFESFASSIDRFAMKYAVIEFVPSDDVHVSRWPLARESWYSVEAFIAAMSPYFTHVRALPSTPAPRSIHLFERALPSTVPGE
jgi:SAM-dependent methyltransferase